MDSYERKLSNHQDQGRRQGAISIIEFFSVTHTSKKNRRGKGACVRRREGGACATAQWHNGQSKPGSLFNILEQSTSAIGGNNCSAIRMRSVLGVENFPRHDNFRDTNDVDFTKEFAESLADRCKSRPTSEMYNATLSKH